MFRCGGCGNNTIAREKMNRIVVERRKKTYHVVKAIKSKKRRGRFKKIKKEMTVEGWEIVRELQLCPECYHAYQRRANRMLNKND